MNGAQGRRASLATIAARAGVSISTVSRVVNGHLNRANAETVARIQALIEEYGYRPDSLGRALRRGESRLVAMLVPNLDNPAMAAIASSTEAALRAIGHVTLLCDTHDDPEIQDDYLAAMRAHSVRGYVLVSCVASHGLAAFLKRDEPAVLVGRRQPRGLPAAPFVGIDDVGAGREAADFLLDAGIERPALLHSALSSSAIADRVIGFSARLVERGVPKRAIRIGRSDRRAHLESGYEAIRGLVAAGGWPAGMMCVSDQMAYGAWRHAHETGVAVPEDCLIIGVDENPLNAWIAPWLTSVHVPYEDYGAAIVAQLEARWSGERSEDILLAHRLVRRS
ncbi:MAG: LacI family transcriptional regulator [Siculibacillus sp.]|nr:LacI family transcriptional regulator [Siculibacillus sp.]